MVPMPGERANVLVGQSPKLHQVGRLIEKLAQSRNSVLILGECGTGKEVVARSIYNKNPKGPFVTIDCSSLVGPLMESELFGHVKGSFTGALNTKIGLLELANNGTAFFDEIGELPLELQAKLLRVLQEKEYRPVGSLVTKRSDFRIVAATNKDLEKEVDKGTFRKDLYYRLKVVNVRLAPLRERREDVPALVAHFLERFGSGHVLTQECLEAMLTYDWPGNVRELEHAIEGMVAIHTGPLLHVQDLPSCIRNFLHHQRLPAMAAAASTMHSTSQGIDYVNAQTPQIMQFPNCPVPTLIEMERRMIQQALEYTKGDRLTAATILGIGRTTLYRKLKEYQMEA